MFKLKVVTVVGARPQFIKMSRVSSAIKKNFREVILHTGQHYDRQMSSDFFQQLRLPRVDYNLGVHSCRQGEQTAKMMIGIERVLIKEKPSLVITYGDTNSTLAAVLSASKLRIPIAHIEAGMRSFNYSMPEEINRVVADQVSTFLFCPTKTAVINLKREGITRNVFLVGDVMYDALDYYLSFSKKDSRVLASMGLKAKKYQLLTIHRAENTVDARKLKPFLSAVNKLNLLTVFPVHPRTRKLLKGSFKTKGNLIFAPPVSYLDMLALESNARRILTDSGGVQKEAHILNIPCFTLRKETEWVETLIGGANRLLDINKRSFSSLFKILSNDSLKCKRRTSLMYGNGRAAEKISRILKERLS